MGDVIYKREIEQGDNSEKQLDVVEKILKNGRRVFGSSGASLTHQIHNPSYSEAGIDSTLAKIGMEGEHATSKLIREWMKDKPNVVLVESVHIKGMGKEEVNEETGVIEGGDTDHILIIGDFIVLIDSKNWKGKKKYGVNKEGNIVRSNKTFPGGNVKTREALFMWKKYLAPYSAMFNSIINITSEKVYVVRDVNWWKQPFKVVEMENFTEWLDKVWEAIPDDSKEEINVNLVTAIVKNIIKPYDVVKEMFGSVAHLLDI